MKDPKITLPKKIDSTIHEIEQQAYKDYAEAKATLGEYDLKVQALKYRHLGMLELKTNLLYKFNIGE